MTAAATALRRLFLALALVALAGTAGVPAGEFTELQAAEPQPGGLQLASQQLSAIQSGRLGIDPQELRCLALNVYFEAGGEPRPGRVAVAWVTINRWVDQRFPRTLCDVVKDGGEQRYRCQFHWWCDGLPDDPTNPERWADAEEAARDALTGRREDPTGGALFFHADSVRPGWSRAMTPTARIGNHLFYR